MQSTTAICPSLFNATTAQDGILSRIRLPAGLITSTQCELLATVVNQFGNGEIQITNRANLQIRTSQTPACCHRRARPQNRCRQCH